MVECLFNYEFSCLNIEDVMNFKVFFSEFFVRIYVLFIECLEEILVVCGFGFILCCLLSVSEEIVMFSVIVVDVDEG